MSRNEIFVVLVLSIGLSGCYSSVERDRAPNGTAAQVSVSVSLSAHQAALVRAHFTNANPGRGRGGRDRLPPGIEKKLARGQAIPPGIAKQYLPADLRVQLPVLPNGMEYVVVASKLLLVEAATQIIRQVLLDAVA